MFDLFSSARLACAKREDGFSLLELLLVVGVTALIFTGIAAVSQSFINGEVATSGGQYLNRVATVTNNYVDANWSKLPATDDAVNDVNPNWVGLKDSLDKEGLLTGGVLRNPLGSPMRISFNIAGTPTDPIYRISVYTTTPIDERKVRDAARQAGSFGGTITSFGGATRAVGAYSQYNVDTALLTTTPFGLVPTATKGYLIAFTSRNGSAYYGSFLYRNAITNHPELNQMTTDLNMDGNNVTNAANVQTQDLNVANTASLGATTVNGNATFNGPTTMSGALTANNGVDVNGNANFSGNVTMTNGTLNVDTLNSNTLQAADITSNNFKTQDLNVTGGAITVDDDINVNGNVTASGEVLAPTINAGTINANGGAMTVGTMDVQNAMQIEGAVTVTGGTISVNRMVADHCTKIYIDIALFGIDPTIDNQGYRHYGACP